MCLEKLNKEVFKKINKSAWNDEIGLNIISDLPNKQDVLLVITGTLNEIEQLEGEIFYIDHDDYWDLLPLEENDHYKVAVFHIDYRFYSTWDAHRKTFLKRGFRVWKEGNKTMLGCFEHLGGDHIWGEVN